MNPVPIASVSASDLSADPIPSDVPVHSPMAIPNLSPPLYATPNTQAVHDACSNLGQNYHLPNSCDNWAKSSPAISAGPVAGVPIMPTGCHPPGTPMQASHNQPKLPDVMTVFAQPGSMVGAAQREDALQDLLKKARIHRDAQPPAPEPIVKLLGETIGTSQNLVTISGQAKSFKSATVEALLASALVDRQPHVSGLNSDTLGLNVTLPEGSAVVLFDTEQSRLATWSLLNRAYERAEFDGPDDWLYAYNVVAESIIDRLDSLEIAVRDANSKNGKVGLVVVDGVADFVNDVNNIEESRCVVERLQHLALKYELCLVLVLHENPGRGSEGKGRGHLGSELERKSEGNLRVVRHAQTNIVDLFGDKCRHAHIRKEDGVRFRFDDALKRILTVPKSREAEETNKRGAALWASFDSVFGQSGRGFERLELVKRIMEKFKCSETTADRRIKSWVDAKWIIKSESGFRRIVPEPPTSNS